MSTQGEDVADAIGIHTEAIAAAGDKIAGAIAGAAISLNNIASAIQKTPRRPSAIAEDPDWPARTPGRHAGEEVFVDVVEGSAQGGVHLRVGHHDAVTRDLLAEVVRDLGSALRENSANAAADRFCEIADRLAGLDTTPDP